MKRVLTGLILGMALPQAAAVADEWSGYVSGQFRGFFEDPADPRQHNTYLSAAAEPRYYRSWQGGDQSVETRLFYRVD